MLKLAAISDGIQDRLRPAAGFDIEIGGAGRIAEFGSTLPGQPVIDVVMGQQNRCQPVIVFRFMLLQPEDF